MSINTNFNANPYYDDYDEDKKFLRMLFKPGYAVQARELTQLQTILQKQVERFGNHIFQNGSVVTGGQTFLQDVTYLKLDSTYAGSAVTANNFIGATIVDSISTPTKRAEVIRVYDADSGTGDPKTLLVKQIIWYCICSGDTILTFESSPTSANISTSGVGTGQVFSVSDGVYYYDGYFIKNTAQTIATSKYSNTTANAKIGFEITESTVSSSSDTSLLDPAQDASNYQAPGSDRFKIDLVLSTRSIASTDTTQFIELARVENGVLIRNFKFPIYSVLEDTLARRTYDESGNYTVKPFSISLQTNTSNTANMDVILSPGKAYVFGYEFETISPTVITIEKPRTTELVNNNRLTADYGNFVYTTNHFGSLPINSLITVDLHCVSNGNINLTSTSSITNTKIGTARVKSLSFDSASNTSNSSTYAYKTFLFDVNVGSITGNVNTATSSTVSIGNTTASQIYSSVTDAYKGAKLRITNGNGSNETAKFITGFDATTQTLSLAENFINTPANGTSQFSIDFEFNDVESIATTSSTTKLNAADIDIRSKDTASRYSDAFLTDGSFEPVIFRLGEDYITQNTITDFSFSYRRLYEAQSFVASDSPALSVGSGETISTASSTSAIQQNYQVIVTSTGSSPYAVGQTIPADKITAVNTGTRKLTITNANNMTANIVATINYSLATGSPAKTKTLVSANSTVQTTGGESINTNGVIVYASQGQTTIRANNVVKVPGTAQSLYVSDVISIEQVLDFNGSAVANTGGTDITGRYTLDNGQRDSYYNHASIKLKAGQTAPIGPLVVRYNAYSSSGAGFFTADSYPSYDSIPSFTSPTTGTVYNLRDCLDFRPVRKSATNALDSGTVTTVFDVDSSTTGPKIPENGSDILLDYSYYLPRVDKVVLNKSKTFDIIKGTPSLNPVQSKNKDDSMNLYILTEPAYVANTSDISVQYINNRRYTMRDIGNLDQRIGNLEYYTSLSLLEQDTVNKQDLTILDSTNLPRFKNGIVVDSFKGHSVASVTSTEYQASIDTKNQEMRPSFNISSRMLTFDAANSSNYLQTGPFVTVASSNTEFISQALASKTMNINPFNVVNYIGRITLNPPSDVWVDTSRKPDVLVNIGGDKDAWDLLLNNNRNTSLIQNGFTISGSGFGYGSAPTLTISGGGGSGASATATISGGRVTGITLTNPGTGYTSVPTITVSGGSPTTAAVITYDSDFLGVGNFSYEWGDWSTIWSGTTTTGVQRGVQGNTGGAIRGAEIGRNTITETSTSGITRTGIASSVSVDTITQTIGDRVVDVSVIPYMRSRSILFTASDFKPDTVLYPFFDNATVEKYVGRANRFILAQNNLAYNVKTSQTETVNVYNNATSTSNGQCVVVKTSNNSVFVVNINPTTTWNIASANLIGQTTGTSVRISGYEHFSGLANTATANTIVLSLDVTGANNEGYYGNTSNSNIISIVAGTGAGQQRTISSYNAAIRTATVSSNWTTTPDITSVYSIGRLTTTRSGDVAGIYTIPTSTFRVGEKLFRLTNTPTGDVPSSTTNGDASFYAQGLLQTVENTIISTIAPTIQRVDVTDTRVTSTITSSHNEIFYNYYDPLAQTFLVAPTQYPQGIFVDKIRVCFKTKDVTAPVTLQLRPTVNGYPSSTTIYPYGTVTLTPDKVKVTDSPDLDDATKYTDFVFDAPIYMLPGEHSFVLVSNSNGYEAYVAEVGKLDLTSGLQISEQPYGGSLFLSQNGSTWTADQNMDMQFRIYRKVFDTSPATVNFLVNKPNANLAYDLAHLTTSEVTMANTSLAYSFLSEKATGGLTSYLPINPKEDYTMDDGNGRRILNPGTGNTTFILKTTMSTNNPAISPFLDITRFSSIFVDNWINDLPLINSDFVIVNSGSSYANSTDVTVSITGGNGSGATATANVVGGIIDAIYVTNPGSGYTTSPTITITPGSGGGSGASVSYNGEDKKSGGNSAARYLTRKVTLADGFDSGDLRVYLTGYKPSGSGIYVYYKVLSGSDSDVFDDKNYQLMTELGNPNFISANKQDYRELTFAPGIVGAANNTINYTTSSTAYNSFKTFAIKVVMSGSNTTDVPKVRDIRAIALPAGN
jgi:hypothetical protein